MSTDDIWATVVLYHPDDETLSYIEQLSRWIRLVVVDNSPNVQRELTQGITFISNGKNLGVAAALNQGMRYARVNGANWCLLLDQDSRLSHQDITALKKELKAQAGAQLAILAPIYYCNNVERYGDAILFEDGKLMRSGVSLSSGEHQLYPASYVISSGSLVNLDVCEKIGWHDESLFIDFVDVEWGLRARSHGYNIYLTNRVCLQHSIGDNPICLGKQKVVNHSPVRHYYYFRNVLHMLRKPYVPMQWKLRELAKLCPRFLLYACFTDNKSSQVKHMLKGVLHGLLGRKGSL